MEERHVQALKRAEASVEKVREQVAKDPKRLRYHLMAPAYWINDPCGLVQFRGEYHVFYQFNPYASLWGHIHWGHAKSRDLIHWEHLPIALAPSEAYDMHPRGGIFTGCAVVDGNVMKVIYCGSTGEGETLRQVQCLAFSEDGIHFHKWEGNPVIPGPPAEGSENFRDPNIWRHGDFWYMVLGSCKNGRGKALLYRSRDLTDWAYVSVLAESDGTLGTMWECPDFFPLGEKYVLIFSPMGIEGVKGLCLVGDLDYETGKFVWETKGEIDYGFEYYAPQTFEDDRHRRIMFGWIGAWEWMPGFQDFGPTVKDNWYGAISLPRVLSLDETNHLRCAPAKETETLREEWFHWEACSLAPEERLVNGRVGGACLEIKLLCDLSKTNAEEWTLFLRTNEKNGQRTALRYVPKTGELIFDRSRSDTYSRGENRCVCLAEKDGRLLLHIFVDTSCVEIYANHGKVCMTNRIYPEASSVGTELCARGGSVYIESLDIWTLHSIWSENT